MKTCNGLMRRVLLTGSLLLAAASRILAASAPAQTQDWDLKRWQDDQRARAPAVQTSLSILVDSMRRRDGRELSERASDPNEVLEVRCEVVGAPLVFAGEDPIWRQSPPPILESASVSGVGANKARAIQMILTSKEGVLSTGSETLRAEGHYDESLTFNLVGWTMHFFIWIDVGPLGAPLGTIYFTRWNDGHARYSTGGFAAYPVHCLIGPVSPENG